MARLPLGDLLAVTTASILVSLSCSSSKGPQTQPGGPDGGVDAPPPEPPPEETESIVLLSTTDLHANIAPYDYCADAEAQDLGLAKVTTLIRAARVENPCTLLVDSGDTIQGTPPGTLYARASGGTHPMAAAMKRGRLRRHGARQPRLQLRAGRSREVHLGRALPRARREREKSRGRRGGVQAFFDPRRLRREGRRHRPRHAWRRERGDQREHRGTSLRPDPQHGQRLCAEGARGRRGRRRRGHALGSPQAAGGVRRGCVLAHAGGTMAAMGRDRSRSDDRRRPERAWRRCHPGRPRSRAHSELSRSTASSGSWRATGDTASGR